MHVLVDGARVLVVDDVDTTVAPIVDDHVMLFLLRVHRSYSRPSPALSMALRILAQVRRNAFSNLLLWIG